MKFELNPELNDASLEKACDLANALAMRVVEEKWIDLSAQVFDLSAVASGIEDRIQVLTKDKTGLIWMPHACTVIAGWESLTDARMKASIVQTLDIEEPRAPVFTVPSTWRMPHVMKALGCFKSNGEAAKNGWNKDIVEGMTLHTFKLAHSKWAFTTFKVPRDIR